MENKKSYETPEITMVEFDVSDRIMTSGYIGTSSATGNDECLC